MEVYVLDIWEWHEGGWPIGVYSSRDRAVEAGVAWVKKHRNKGVTWPDGDDTLEMPGGERVSMTYTRMVLDAPARFTVI